MLSGCRWIIALFFVAVSLASMGCKEKTKTQNLGGEEATQIALLVEEVNEAAGNSQKLAGLFATGSAPSDAQKFTKYAFTIVGKASVSGTTGTIKVRVDSAEGQKLGEQDWTFEKEGDKWKIKTAPLPQ